MPCSHPVQVLADGWPVLSCPTSCGGLWQSGGGAGDNVPWHSFHSGPRPPCLVQKQRCPCPRSGGEHTVSLPSCVPPELKQGSRMRGYETISPWAVRESSQRRWLWGEVLRNGCCVWRVGQRTFQMVRIPQAEQD